MSECQKCDRLNDALQQLVDWVKDGCADEMRVYCMTEAQAALKGLQIAGDDGWQPISTAPRDGTWIEVTANDEPIHKMCWNRFAGNELVQDGKGIWWGHGFTWSEEKGFGPTRWRPGQRPRRASNDNRD